MFWFPLVPYCSINDVEFSAFLYSFISNTSFFPKACQNPLVSIGFLKAPGGENIASDSFILKLLLCFMRVDRIHLCPLNHVGFDLYMSYLYYLISYDYLTFLVVYSMLKL